MAYDRRVKKALELRTDEGDFPVALETLSSFYNDNSMRARQALRGDIEQRHLQLATQLLASLSLVKTELEHVQHDMDNMTSSVAAINERLVKTRQQTVPVLKVAAALRSQRADAQQRYAIAIDVARQVEDSKKRREFVVNSSLVRRAALLQEFTDAMIGPVGSTGARPIEVHAHDAIRYVGDMLAWLHTTVASERDSLASVCGVTSSDSTDIELRDIVNNATAAAFEGDLCRQFCQRVEQSLSGQSEALISYRLAGLLALYADTIGKLIGSAAPLVIAMQQAHDFCMNVFDERATLLREKLQLAQPLAGPDLGPPAVVRDIVHLLRGVLESDATTIVPIKDHAADKLALSSVEIVAKWAAGAGSASDVFALNCMDALAQPLIVRHQQQQLPEEGAVATLQSACLSRANTIATTAAEAAITESGLGRIHSKLSQLDPGTIKAAVRSFYTAIADGITVPHPADLIISAQYATQVRAVVVARLLETYEEIYSAAQTLPALHGVDVAPVSPADVQRMVT
eukprot:TRINITY_DN10821_c0_g1_i1.p1 TRINITY_DN10821_c0_g1~~TRINITY_DN10821_c0_g1_i1.p1  ORF type:complete len:515 (+),score=127.11 TRINITY_DN10821_c0_g1_i1:79-1623(+)